MAENDNLPPAHEVPGVGSRVELKGRQGRILEIKEGEHPRAYIKWDSWRPGMGENETDWHNIKPLKLLKPPLQTFCAWCLMTLKPGEAIILNPGSGAAAHLSCGVTIAKAVGPKEPG